MFILVGYSSSCGMGGIYNHGKFDTREDAAKEIAKQICRNHDIGIDVDDFISIERPYDNGYFRYDNNNTHIWFDDYECIYCDDDGCEDDWLIIEV